MGKGSTAGVHPSTESTASKSIQRQLIYHWTLRMYFNQQAVSVEVGYKSQFICLSRPVSSKYIMIDISRADSRFVPGHWETLLQSNAISHWLGANLESALYQ